MAKINFSDVPDAVKAAFAEFIGTYILVVKSSVKEKSYQLYLLMTIWPPGNR